jgi:hypothetical protein
VILLLEAPLDYSHGINNQNRGECSYVQTQREISARSGCRQRG